MLLKAVIVSTLIIGTLGQAYEDRRCRCLCPSPAEVFNATVSARKYFITDVPPSKCNCVGVILPRIGAEIKGKEQQYCTRCECKYETRNTTIIKVTVITVIWLITLLVVYAAFLTCLDPLIRRQRAQSYKDHNSEEVAVTTVIWLITLLVVYAAFLTYLDPLIRRQRAQSYKDHNSEEARLLMQGYDDED